MLYEVITHGTHPPSFILAQRPALFNQNQITDIADILGVICHVITSYSIHYTKLYEGPQIDHLGLDPFFG